MPFRYLLSSGGTIEADTASEMQELLDIFKQEPQLELQKPLATLVTDLVPEASNRLINTTTVQPELQQTQQTLIVDLAPEALNTGISENESNVISPVRVPSVQDFCHLWYAIKRETQREVIRLLAERDNKKLPIQELEQHIGERCKGSMGGIGRIFHRITGLTWQDYFVLNNSQGVYEVNKNAHQNLIRALEIVEPKH